MAINIFLLRFVFFVASLLSLEGSVFAFEGRLRSVSHQLHHLQPTTHHTLRLNSLFPSAVCSPSDHAKGHLTKGASLQVFNKHGPCYPTQRRDRKPSPPPDHAQILALDEARVASIQSRLAKNPAAATAVSGRRDSPKATKTTLPNKFGGTLGSANYIVTVGLGSPKKDLPLIFDTGSDVSWTQCQPCLRYCYRQQDPIFDPSASRSYANLSCNSPSCKKLQSATGFPPGCSASTCLYGIQYGDGSISVGFFAKDKLTLTPTEVFDDFQFGCGQYNRGLYGETAGLLGLGRNSLSLVSQTAQKYGRVFSYCLPSSGSSTGYLTFGGGDHVSTKEVKFTPATANPDYPSFYFLELVGISVAEHKLPIPTSVFSTAGTLIDSGTVISRLPPKAYSSLQKAFTEGMSKYPKVDGVSILDTCYDLSKYEREDLKVPKIVLYFSGDVEVELGQEGILYALKPSQVCLGFAGNVEDDAVGVIGNLQQKTFHVVYDDAQGRVGFAPGGCH